MGNAQNYLPTQRTLTLRKKIRKPERAKTNNTSNFQRRNVKYYMQ